MTSVQYVPTAPRDQRMHRPEIAASWRRSMLSGLDAGVSMDVRSIGDIDADSPFARVSLPVLDRFREQTRGHRFAAMLVDAHARMLRTETGCSSLIPVIENIGAVTGALWTEDETGTNALATPHETRKPIFIHGDEHYVDALKEYSCYGAPVINPVTRRLEGVLDVMSDSAEESVLMRPFVDQMVSEIQRSLRRARGNKSEILLAAFEAASTHPSSTVVAISRSMVLQNASATALLTAADLELLRSLADAPPRHGTGKLSLTLQSGIGATADIEAVPNADGIVVRLQASIRPVVPRTAKPLDTIEQNERIISQLRNDPLRSAVIIGEPGVGRSTIAQAAIDGRLSCTISAVALSETDGEDALRSELASNCHEVLVIDDLGLLSERCLALVSASLATGTPILATSTPADAHHKEHARALALFASQFTLKPVRELRHQIFELFAAVQPKGPRLRFDGGSARVLASYTWPGNIAELRATVDSLSHRLGGIVTVEDLPERIRRGASSRAMTPWQRATHDAIVNALELMHGNKAHAAEFLGISRSSLYHHLREYRLHA